MSFLDDIRIPAGVYDIIEQHAKDNGKSPHDFCVDGLKEALGEKKGQELVDMLKIADGCPIEALAALIVASREKDST